MPIEVRELIIKATVLQDGASGQASGVNSSGNNSVSSNEEIINACVEKILEIINQKNER